ncbi:class I SAM-dependent methyltransferase [Candidatus Omnitrophota bacterium]
MPSSFKNTIIPVVEAAEQIKPSSVLDIGIGFGKWGFLLREYLEVSKEHDIYGEEGRFKWTLKIDGIEVCEKYIKDLHRSIYNNIFVGDAFNLIDGLGQYDLVILGDVIEHFEKEKGRALVRKCVDKARKAVIISTPTYFFNQRNWYGNVAEKHKSLWTESDFSHYQNIDVYYSRGVMVVIIKKISKKIRLENSDRFRILHRFIASLQSRNINKYGTEGFDRGNILNFYNWLRTCKYWLLKRTI